jgi:hypothetical protein
MSREFKGTPLDIFGDIFGTSQRFFRGFAVGGLGCIGRLHCGFASVCCGFCGCVLSNMSCGIFWPGSAQIELL